MAVHVSVAAFTLITWESRFPCKRKPMTAYRDAGEWEMVLPSR